MLVGEIEEVQLRGCLLICLLLIVTGKGQENLWMRLQGRDYKQGSLKAEIILLQELADQT